HQIQAARDLRPARRRAPRWRTPSCPDRLGKGTREAISARPCDSHRDDLADAFCGCRDMYALQVGAPPNHLPIVTARLFYEHRQNFADTCLVELTFLLTQKQLQGGEAIRLHSLGNLAGGGCGGGAGPLE